MPRALTASSGELERRLDAQSSTSPETSSSTNTELIDTGRFEQLPAPQIIEELYVAMKFFNRSMALMLNH
jgi:hypothetical protein